MCHQPGLLSAVDELRASAYYQLSRIPITYTVISNEEFKVTKIEIEKINQSLIFRQLI